MGGAAPGAAPVPVRAMRRRAPIRLRARRSGAAPASGSRASRSRKKSTTATLTASRKPDRDQRDRQAAILARDRELGHARAALPLALDLGLAQRIENEAHAPACGAACASVGVPGRAERGIEHELRLQARDAVHGEAAAALELLDEVLKLRVEVVLHGGGRRQAAELFEPLAQPAHVLAAHAGAQRPLRVGLRPPQHEKFAEPVVGELRDRHARLAAADQEPRAVRIEPREHDLVRRAARIDRATGSPGG